MNQDIVYSSEFIEITKKSDGYYIESFRTGMSVEQFNKIMTQHPEMRITSFMAIKNAILFAPKAAVKFGEVKERMFVEISSDQLKAYITLCVLDTEMSPESRSSLVKEIITKLSDNGIVYGIKTDVLMSNLCNNKQILIAEGTPPVNGEDSVIKMYELKDPKPEVKEDGNVDHYELNLINKVNAGDWLGERKDPSEGIPGKSVKGEVIFAMSGKKFPLFYDKNSVKEIYEDGITTLYALRTGAVNYDGEKISVSNHLEITGDVDFKVGNIDFDGFLTVKGTIEDNFCVSANKDIEVLGDYGIGSIREIISRDGSIYIKGGIAGKNKAVIKSKKDLYSKFISDATVICEGSVHIGFYCLNSNIIAKEVILDSPKGQIIGGNIQAVIKVVSSIIGSTSEKRTIISIKGFDRIELKERLEKNIEKIERIKSELAKYKQEISIYAGSDQLSREQRNMYENTKEKFYITKDNLRNLEEERKTLIGYLRAHGEGEIAILKKAYPNTVLEIKKITKEIEAIIMGTTFYIQDGEIKEL